jgi:hypothetical protein
VFQAGITNRANAMPEYRLYVVGTHRNILSRVEFECADDAAAIEVAKEHIEANDIELWHRDRLVAKFDYTRK